jgi:AraC-like DNA-binding protein
MSGGPTGQNTQRYIHDKVIVKANEKPSINDLTISEITYGPGLEHLQSLRKLFKTKTKLSRLEFRQSFNWLTKTKATKPLRQPEYDQSCYFV